MINVMLLLTHLHRVGLFFVLFLILFLIVITWFKHTLSHSQ